MTRKIKILQVVNHLGFAGMEAGVIKLANRLPKDEFETTICVLIDVAKDIDRTIDSKVRIIEFGKIPGIDLRAAWWIAKVSKEINADIIHSHNWGTYVYAALARLLGAHGHFLHGEHGRDEPDLHISWAKQLFIAASKSSVAWYTSVAQHLGDEFKSAWRLPAEKLVVLPNGVDLERFQVSEPRAAIRQSLGIPESARVIGTVGNIRPIKGFDTIFSAASKLAHQYPGLVVVVCGGNQSGKNKPQELQTLIEAQCAPAKVIFLNTRPDVERVLRSFDIFVNSSYLEGMSNAILEAMASGCPVIASDIAGNRELLQDGKMNNLFAVGDAQALANRISVLLDNKALRDELVARQTALVSEKFSAEVSLERYIQFYRMVMDTHGDPKHAK